MSDSGSAGQTREEILATSDVSPADRAQDQRSATTVVRLSSHAQEQSSTAGVADPTNEVVKNQPTMSDPHSSDQIDQERWADSADAIDGVDVDSAGPHELDGQNASKGLEHQSSASPHEPFSDEQRQGTAKPLKGASLKMADTSDKQGYCSQDVQSSSRPCEASNASLCAADHQTTGSSADDLEDITLVEELPTEGGVAILADDPVLGADGSALQTDDPALTSHDDSPLQTDDLASTASDGSTLQTDGSALISEGETPLQTDDPASTNDLIEAAQLLQSKDLGTTAEFAPIPLTPQQLKEQKSAAKAAKKAAKQPLSWYAISDVGLVRDHNEDSYLAHPPLFAVCDGMGGHAAGEVASSIAIDAICRHAPLTADDVALGAAIEAANTAVIEGATSGRGKEGMGCTATCCIIKDERIAIAHVGDSRCYILHNGIMTRMTEDHSLVEDLVKQGSISADEARDHRYRSIITRALGSEPDMYADHLSTTIDRGDRILLCSDGLSSMVSDYMIERTLCQDADAQATCEALLQQALEAGGHDNITIVVIDVASDVQRKRATRKTLKAVAFWMIGVLVACAVLVAAAALYINQTYFLTTVNGHVTVYQGVPGQIFGMPLHHLQNETTIVVDDLPASIQQNLRDTISVSSKEEADKLLEDYRKQSDEKKLKDAEKLERSKESQGGQHE